MRIVSRQTFLLMPPGTVYAKCRPWIFEAISVKGETVHNDFLYQDISPAAIDARDTGEWADMLQKSRETGCELPMDFDCMGRDGCFDESELFAVLSAADVSAMISRLAERVKQAAPAEGTPE